MKNLKLSVILALLSVFMFNSANAGAKIWYKSKCNFFVKNYNAHAAILGIGFIPSCVQYNRSCYYTADSRCSKHCGFAQAKYGINSSTYQFEASASWYSNCFYVKAGHMTELTEAIEPLMIGKNSESSEDPISMGEFSSKGLSVNHETRKMIFNNISGRIAITSKSNQESILVLSGWVSKANLSEGDEDVKTDENTFWTSKIYLSDLSYINELEESGKIKYLKTNNGYEVIFENISIEVDIPKEIDAENVNVEVELDGGEIEKTIYNKAIDISETLIKKNGLEFNLFPNPSSNNITVSFKSDLDKNVRIKVYDLNGKMVYSNLVLINKGMNSSLLNISEFVSGQYFIVIDGLEEVPLVKKFIKD